MAQKIFGIGLGASGIVGTLIVAGIILTKLDVSASLGGLAIFSGIVIGIVLGILGIAGVIKRLS